MNQIAGIIITGVALILVVAVFTDFSMNEQVQSNSLNELLAAKNDNLKKIDELQDKVDELTLQIKVLMPEIPLAVDGNEIIITPGTSSPGCGEISCYEPYIIKVYEGERVTWKNVDGAKHTVTSGSFNTGPDGVFDSGVIVTNDKFGYIFDEAGTYDYYCTIHPWKTGEILVKPKAPNI